MRQKSKIQLAYDDEELEAMIDFQRHMIEGAKESGEVEEVKWRTARLEELKSVRG